MTKHRRIRGLAAAFALSLAVTAFGSCDEDDGTGNGLESTATRLVFAEDVGTGCTASPAGTHKLPADVDWLVARLILNETGEPTDAITILPEDLEKDSGDILMKKVAPGNYTLEVAGCKAVEDGDPVTTWLGSTPSVDVEKHQKAAPAIFLSHAGGASCVGGDNLNLLAPGFDGNGFSVEGKTAFGAVAVTDSGRVISAGGSGTLKSNPEKMSGTAWIWEYRRDLGLFTAVVDEAGGRATLGDLRLLHSMWSIGGEDLLIAGGARHAQIAPKGFPGSVPPVVPDTAAKMPLEIVSVDTAKTVPLALSVKGALPTVALNSKKTNLAVLGGLIIKDAAPSDQVLFVPVDAAKMKAGKVDFKEGKLATPRFGGEARFLSTGQLLVIGGLDGTAPAKVELVTAGTDGVPASVVVEAAVLPEGTRATAFPAVYVLADNGKTARILVVGGNPLGTMPSAYVNPDKPNAWVLTMTAKNKAFDPASAKVSAIVGDADWATRSMATITKFGSSLLLVGGYRSYSSMPTVADCHDPDGLSPDYCFPRSWTAFGLGADGKSFVDIETFQDTTSRFGASVAVLGGNSVLVLGGLSGYGGAVTDDHHVLSTGALLVTSGGFDPAVCIDPLAY